MANWDNSKKSIKGLKPVEAGFVRFFEMMESYFKEVEETYGTMKTPDPTIYNKPKIRRNPNRPVYDHLEQTPWGGGIVGE